MRRAAPSRIALALPLVAALGAPALVGCGDEPIRVGQGVRPPPAAPATTVAMDAGVDAGPFTALYGDDDFVEAENNRDPFRTFPVDPQRGDGGVGPQIQVKMPNTSVEEMRLIGIITGLPDPRAMINDREGTGWVVRRGDAIGRTEAVQAGGTDAITVYLNWRVERIRPNEVVLARDDPSNPEGQPMTRVIPLREGELTLR
ncbi:MAG: pilus assembly protein PilP [Sandaracinaceae bacterium]